MSTAIAISLPVAPPPNPEVLAPESDSIALLDQELRTAATAYRKSLARLAYYGFRMRLAEGWTAFGFEPGSAGENAYREQVLEVPRSSYFRAVKIGQALHQLSLEELEAIRPTNLDLLMQVSPSLWHEFRWVNEARVMKPKRFAELVAERNQSAGDDREPMSTYSVKVPFLAKQALEAMVESFRKRHELDSAGRAVELMVADIHDRPNLVAAAHQAQQLLHGVLQSLRGPGLTLTPEAKEWIRLAKELLDAASAQAVQTARSQSAGGEAVPGWA